MRKAFISFAVASLGLVGLIMVAEPAAAAPSYDPNIARVANPANACKSIPASVAFAAEKLGMPTPDLSSFSYSDCVKTLARGDAFVEPAEFFGDPYAQCDELALPYPFTLHSGEAGPEDEFLPDLTVNNRKQCGSALYAYHAIVTALFGDLRPPE